MVSYYFERALFVVGESNSGKSKQLRSIFRDLRLGEGGNIPSQNNINDIYRISNERSLYLRLTSPHESYEYIDTGTITGIPKEVRRENFFEKTERKITSNTPGNGRRWNFACPLQPNATNYMPDAADTIYAFAARFDPERIRVLFLSPDRSKIILQPLHIPLVNRLRSISSVEIAWIDARDMTANGLLISDFFDFT